MTIQSNLVLIAAVTLSIVTPHHSVATASEELGPVEMASLNRVAEKNQYEAIAYCATRGGLPSILQLARAFNPEGVRYSPEDGFYPVMPIGGTSFYYNHTTYHRPALTGNDAIDYAFYWSSSIPIESNISLILSGRSTGEGLIFDTVTGLIQPASSRFDHYLLRCLTDPSSRPYFLPSLPTS